MARMDSTPAAHATALPPYVPPIEPTSSLSIISVRLNTPESGMPDASPFAAVMISGTTWKCSKANHFPVRPKPDWTSSKISMIPCLSQISRKPFMNETGGTTYPPSPKTDSTKMAAVSLGAVCEASKYSSCSSEYSEASASVILKRNAYGNGATYTPEGNGPNPER